MALKTITYTIEADKTLTPATIQDAGMQGDHKATKLLFRFSDGLNSYLQQKAIDGKLVYRFDGYDGQGGVHRGDTNVLTDKSVEYPLEYTVTCYGGIVKVELIISCISEDGETSEEVLHTKAAELKLIFSPYHSGNELKEYKDLSALAEIVKDYALRAERAEQAAKEAKEETRLLSSAFQNGTTYIFNGGNASGEIDANFIIDSEMSDYSSNCVKNKVIKKYVDNNFNFPVGSVWIGGKKEGTPINPSEVFGGTWELFDKTFTRQRIYRETNRGHDLGQYLETTKNDDGSTNYGNGVNIRGLSFDYTEHCISMTVYANFNEEKTVQSDFVLFNLISSAIGINPIIQQETGKYDSFIYTRYFIGQCDANNAAACMLKTYPNLDTGSVSVSYVNAVSNRSTILKNDNLDVTFSIQCEAKNMLDDFCDCFYWKKIAN